jgi:hypothetical protein
MGGTVAGGEMNPSEKLSFRKRALVGRTFWSWTQKGYDRFRWRPLRFGNHTFGWRPAWFRGPFYTLAFVLQLRRSAVNLSQGSRLVLEPSRCVELATFLWQPRLTCWASVVLDFKAEARLHKS